MMPDREYELLSMMDANKIGTDATSAQHIKTIEDRKYAERVDPNRQHFRPTPIGVALVEAYEQMNVLLNKPALRQTMEADCRAISLGQMKAILTHARRRCQALRSVDDTYAEIIKAIEAIGELNRTYVIISSDHGA